eukprot:m.169544 g.169544  ORF g.169544 m.169544 type:complete len:186 (+) comp39002_c0_seq10:18-575(+)
MGQSLGTSILERSSSKRCTGVQSQQEFCIDVIETWKYSYYSVVRVEWRHWLYMYHRRGNIEARGVRSFEELELSAARKSDLEKMISEECQRSASSCRPFSTGSAQRKVSCFWLFVHIVVDSSRLNINFRKISSIRQLETRKKSNSTAESKSIFLKSQPSHIQSFQTYILWEQLVILLVTPLSQSF